MEESKEEDTVDERNKELKQHIKLLWAFAAYLTRAKLLHKIALENQGEALKDAIIKRISGWGLELLKPVLDLISEDAKIREMRATVAVEQQEFVCDLLQKQNEERANEQTEMYEQLKKQNEELREEIVELKQGIAKRDELLMKCSQVIEESDQPKELTNLITKHNDNAELHQVQCTRAKNDDVDDDADGYSTQSGEEAKEECGFRTIAVLTDQSSFRLRCSWCKTKSAHRDWKSEKKLSTVNEIKRAWNEKSKKKRS